jgi:hypothetical protein
MPPPADAEISVAQLTLLPPELGEELDEHPAVTSVTAAIPANAKRYGDLTSASHPGKCKMNN